MSIMNDTEKTIELTAEDIEEVTGGAGIKDHSNDKWHIIAHSKWERANYVACECCNRTGNVFRQVTHYTLPEDEKYKVLFHCRDCNEVFSLNMVF